MKARELFVAVYRVARLQFDQQIPEIPHLYGDVWPVLEREMLSAMVPAHSSEFDETDLSPEKLAAAYDERGGWPVVAEEARVRCGKILAAHTNEIQNLVHEDLATHEKQRIRRGLQAAGRFKLTGLFSEVVRQLSGSEQDIAAGALREINDPRAIPILARNGMTRHYDVLRSLQRGRRADPHLVLLLKDKDPEVRWRAAYALAESGDRRLTRDVKRLLDDEASEVRVQGASIAFLLPSDAFSQLRPQLVRLLSDQAIDVRSWVTIQFANHKDPICAQSLYQLLAQEQKLENWRQSNLVQALQNMTGSYFGFIPGTVLPEEERRASLDKFAVWIVDHQNKSSDSKSVRRH